MEKLSKEELIRKFGFYYGALEGEQYEAELLRRLSRLEELEKQVADFYKAANKAGFYPPADNPGKVIAVLSSQLSDSLCCANCKHYRQSYDYSFSCKDGVATYPHKYCPSHEPDGLTREERSA